MKMSHNYLHALSQYLQWSLLTHHLIKVVFLDHPKEHKLPHCPLHANHQVIKLPLPNCFLYLLPAFTMEWAALGPDAGR
jgi:hypothetical protein